MCSLHKNVLKLNHLDYFLYPRSNALVKTKPPRWKPPRQLPLWSERFWSAGYLSSSWFLVMRIKVAIFAIHHIYTRSSNGWNTSTVVLIRWYTLVWTELSEGLLGGYLQGSEIGWTLTTPDGAQLATCKRDLEGPYLTRRILLVKPKTILGPLTFSNYLRVE